MQDAVVSIHGHTKISRNYQEKQQETGTRSFISFSLIPSPLPSPPPRFVQFQVDHAPIHARLIPFCFWWATECCSLERSFFSIKEILVIFNENPSSAAFWWHIGGSLSLLTNPFLFPPNTAGIYKPKDTSHQGLQHCASHEQRGSFRGEHKWSLI